MRIDIATLFPEMCERVFSESIVGRGIKNGFIEVYAHNIRKYTADKHGNVDDKPYGGGTGMVMQAQPIFDCVGAILAQHKSKPRIIYLSPQGETLTQKKVSELAREDGLILICGHYEGVDERVLDELQVEEISVGDYVLTGGELPALILTDAVARLQKGVLPNEDAYSIESHFNGLLEFPQYSRPEIWHGRRVPEVLLCGDHRQVSDWQYRQSLRVTAKKRPDMYEAYMDAILQDFWDEFAQAKEIDANIVPEIYKFGRNEQESNRLLKLILRGKKRAAISPLFPVPDKGQFSIVTDWDGIPRCIIRTIRAQKIRLNEITREQMIKESGEDNPEKWLEVHRDFLKTNAPLLDYDYSDDMSVVFEEFRLEYKR